MEKFFGIRARGSSVGREVIGGWVFAAASLLFFVYFPYGK